MNSLSINLIKLKYITENYGDKTYHMEIPYLRFNMLIIIVYRRPDAKAERLTELFASKRVIKDKHN